MKIAQNILELIGKTPLVKLNRMAQDIPGGANILLKLENFNPGYSVKDRIAIAMISDAEKMNLIYRGTTTIIEPSSGNTGIALAMVCAVKGYKLIITMPESMSIERRNLITGFGAEIVLTPALKGMKGAVEKAQEIAGSIKNSFVPNQFKNPSNVQYHRKTTAVEIWNDTCGRVDIFVAGVGTGGTLTGVGEIQKEKKPSVRCIAVEPADSPVLGGGQPSPHKIQGIGAGFIPEILNTKIYNEIIQVKNEEAVSTARRLIKEEGILCGISSGANVFASLHIAKRPENKSKLIVTVIADTGERYLSTDLFSASL